MKGKMQIASSVLLSLFVVGLLAACGGEWEEYAPSGNLPEDKAATLTYPSGTPGTKAGELIKNLTLAKALFDPEFMCKGVKDMKLANTEGAETLTLEDLYQGDLWCGGKKQFLWIIISAGW
jgi:hypothetical protein